MSIQATSSQQLTSLLNNANDNAINWQEVLNNLNAYAQQNSSPESGLGTFLSEIQGAITNNDSKGDAACIAAIQQVLNSSTNGMDIYMSMNHYFKSGSPVLSGPSQIQGILNAMFAGQTPPNFNIPSLTVADAAYLNINSYLPTIPLNGADKAFENAMAAAASNALSDSSVSASDLYNALKNISTSGVDPSIVQWYNQLLSGLQSSSK